MGKSTYQFYKETGTKINHLLLGKRVWYRPYARDVVDRFQGTYAGIVIDARRRGRRYITLALRQQDGSIHYATARMLTTRQPRKSR